MKKLLTILLISFLFCSCAKDKTINGVTYRPYGLLNESDCKVDSIHYSASASAIICGAIFFEVIIPPIYVFGYNLYEPVCLKKDYKEGMKGVIDK